MLDRVTTPAHGARLRRKKPKANAPTVWCQPALGIRKKPGTVTKATASHKLPQPDGKEAITKMVKNHARHPRFSQGTAMRTRILRLTLGEYGKILPFSHQAFR